MKMRDYSKTLALESVAGLSVITEQLSPCGCVVYRDVLTHFQVGNY
jgi:hypothetical protein